MNGWSTKATLVSDGERTSGSEVKLLPLSMTIFGTESLENGPGFVPERHTLLDGL